VVLEDDIAIESHMKSASFNPRRSAVLEQDAGLQLSHDSVGAAARVNITSYQSNRIVLQVESPANGVLVLSEVFYPGWRASLNGVAAPLLRANWSLRAVPLPAGSHEVEVAFVPASFRFGAAISVATLLAVGVAAFIRRFRR
jgi:uncharacterized membrane protein YfhO